MDEVDAVVLLLEKEHCLDKGAGSVVAFQTDSWNLYKDGLYVGGSSDDAVEGAEQHSFLVQWLIPEDGLSEAVTTKEAMLREMAFRTAVEAAKFYLSKCRELGLEK